MLPRAESHWCAVQHQYSLQRPEGPGTTAGRSVASPLRAALMMLVCALSSKVCSSSVPNSLHCSSSTMSSPMLAHRLLAKSKKPKQPEARVARAQVARCLCAGIPAQTQPLHVVRQQVEALTKKENG